MSSTPLLHDHGIISLVLMSSMGWVQSYRPGSFSIHHSPPPLSWDRDLFAIRTLIYLREIHYFFSHDGRWFITTIIWIIFKLVIRTSWLITFKDISLHTNKIDGYIAYYHHPDNIQTCDKDLVAYYILKTFLFIRTREIHYFFSHDGRWFTSALRDPRGDPTTNFQSIGLMQVSIISIAVGDDRWIARTVTLACNQSTVGTRHDLCITLNSENGLEGGSS